MHKTKMCLIMMVIPFFMSCSDNYQDSLEHYSDLNDIYQDIDALYEEKFQNIKLPDSISTEQPKILYSFQTVPNRRSDTEETKQLLSALVSDLYGACEQSYISLDTYSSPFYKYVSPNGDIYAKIGSDMKYINCAQNLSDGTESNSFWNLALQGKRATFHMNGGDLIAGKTYMLHGTKYGLTDARDYADQLVNNILQYTGYDSAELNTIHVCDVNSKDQLLFFEYEFMLDGIPVNVYGDEHGGNANIVRTGLYIEMEEPNRFSSIEAHHSAIIEKKQELSGPFITLESALRLAEYYLAPEYIYQIADIDICYSSIADYSTPTDVYYYTPSWRIVLKEASYTDGNVINAANPNIVLYVDMLSGKICIYDMINGKQTDFSQYGA